jgi:hypothetical protein
MMSLLSSISFSQGFRQPPLLILCEDDDKDKEKEEEDGGPPCSLRSRGDRNSIRASIALEAYGLVSEGDKGMARERERE